MKISVIGAGLGGLASACLLAEKGHDVTVFEKNSRPGGKISQVETGEYRFDTGPSLLTIPWVVDRLFEECGAVLADYLEIVPVDPICRYWYPDGTRFDCMRDHEQNRAQIRRWSENDADAYGEFMEYSADLYRRTRDAYLFNPLYGTQDLAGLNPLDFLRIDAFRTVAGRVDRSFETSYMKKFFKRFPTYNGSSPWQAPATLNIIPHVELTMGGFYVRGGMYALVNALRRLAGERGVRFFFEFEVAEIILRDGRARGVRSSEGHQTECDLVVSNCDSAETLLELLPGEAVSARRKRAMRRLEPSSSGFVLLLGCDRQFEPLSHHTLFFSEDYRREFRDIFQRGVMPEDPTIYVANTSHTNPSHAPVGGSNLFVLVNAPWLGGNWDWRERGEAYGDFIIERLEKKGLTKLGESVELRRSITPLDFRRRYRSRRGSIYGFSSNSRLSAFLRPRNKLSEIGGLYLVGGSTHPGGGIPLVIQSAFNARELISRYET